MNISYTLTKDGAYGILNQPLVFSTPIVGHDVFMKDIACYLASSGRLTLDAGFMWDFGSGPAIDTPAMVVASAAHDALCIMTDTGKLPWGCRAKADAYFRELLKQNGVSFARRWWCWAGVRSYSKCVAYWKREQ